MLQLETTENKRSCLTSRRDYGRTLRRVELRSLIGRRVKRLEWKFTLFNMMDEEFRRLRRTGVKMSRILVMEIAMNSIDNPNEPLSAGEIERACDTEIVDVITLWFVDSFLELKNIVARRRTDSMIFSSVQQLYMDRSIKFYLGEMKLQYENGPDERCVQNYD